MAGAQRRHSARQRLSGSASIPLTDRRYLAAHSQRKYAVYIARYQILYAIQSEINIMSSSVITVMQCSRTKPKNRFTVIMKYV